MQFKETVSILTQSRFLRQIYRPRSKWPNVNFFGFNEQVLFVDHFGKFFPKSFRGKGVIFALKVWAIPTKNNKSKALLGTWTRLSQVRGKCSDHYTKTSLLGRNMQIDELIHEIRLLMYKRHTNTIKKIIAPPGVRTQITCVEGRGQDHYTMELL